MTKLFGLHSRRNRCKSWWNSEVNLYSKKHRDDHRIQLLHTYTHIYNALMQKGLESTSQDLRGSRRNVHPLKKCLTDEKSLRIILPHHDGPLVLFLLLVVRGCIHVYSDCGSPQHTEEIELKNDPRINGKKNRYSRTIYSDRVVSFRV